MVSDPLFSIVASKEGLIDLLKEKDKLRSEVRGIYTSCMTKEVKVEGEQKGEGKETKKELVRQRVVRALIHE